MRGILFLAALSCLVAGRVAAVGDRDYPTIGWIPQPSVCVEVPSGRVPWIIHARNPNYGWDEHTHRANIALAVNGYRGRNQETISQDDVRKMGLQLEVEVTTALFRNESSKIHENDLALYIHALLATGKNPRNFHCTDLVDDLLHRVESAIRGRRVVHPFLVLALCNSHAVTQDHLETITTFTQQRGGSTDRDGRMAELTALSLKAYACAANLKLGLHKFRSYMDKAEEYLINRQRQIGDGSFGNVYTTSLAVQALTASRTEKFWDKEKALEFLEEESKIQVNMIKAYYIEMALNARSVNFIKDLYDGPLTRCVDPETPTGHYIQYSLKDKEKPDFYFSLTMKVDPKLNFFNVMEKASELNDRYRFNHTSNAQGLPMVHTVFGTPNDAEENKFWRLCRQTDVRHVPDHGSRMTTFRDSPQNLIPNKDEHVTLWYLDKECPK